MGRIGGHRTMNTEQCILAVERAPGSLARSVRSFFDHAHWRGQQAKLVILFSCLPVLGRLEITSQEIQQAFTEELVAGKLIQERFLKRAVANAACGNSAIARAIRDGKWRA